MPVPRKVTVLTVVAVLLSLAAPAAAASGDRDTSFSGDGLATISFGTDGSDRAYGVARSGRKIVVLGSSDFQDGALMRFRAGGALDTTFSGDGKRTFPMGMDQERMGLAVQPDRKIVVAGRHDVSGGSRDFFVERFRAGGAVDTGFGGFVTVDFAGGSDEAYAVAVQSDGRILVGGRAEVGGDFRPAMVRFMPSGAPDSSFGGGDARVTTSVLDASQIRALAVQTDGKIVAVGVAGAAESSSDFLVLRYRPNGTLDPTFSGDGKLRIDFQTYDTAEAVAIQSDGAIVVAGEVFLSGSNSNWAVVRLHPNGSLDHTFSANGRVVTALGDHNDFVSGVVVQPTGKIVAVGDSLQGSDFVGALARYRPGGTLDNSLSGDGKVFDDFGSEGQLQGVLNYPGDRLVAGVTVRQTATDFDGGAARYLAG
ncbi:MAG TPA: hypothetical protein VGB19_05885 [Actinomycetota bacterium]